MTNTGKTKQDLLLVKQDMQQLKQEPKRDMQIAQNSSGTYNCLSNDWDCGIAPDCPSWAQ